MQRAVKWCPGTLEECQDLWAQCDRVKGLRAECHIRMHICMYICTKMCTIQYIIVLITATTIMKMYSNINNGNKTTITVCCNYNKNNNNSVKYAATTKTTASAYFLCIAATTATAPAVAATVASPAANSHLIELHWTVTLIVDSWLWPNAASQQILYTSLYTHPHTYSCASKFITSICCTAVIRCGKSRAFCNRCRIAREAHATHLPLCCYFRSFFYYYYCNFIVGISSTLVSQAMRVHKFGAGDITCNLLCMCKCKCKCSCVCVEFNCFYNLCWLFSVNISVLPLACRFLQLTTTFLGFTSATSLFGYLLRMIDYFFMWYSLFLKFLGY